MSNEEVAKPTVRNTSFLTWEMIKEEIIASPAVPSELDLEAPDVKKYLIMLANNISSQIETIIGVPLGKEEVRERLTTGTSLVINLRRSPIKSLKEVTLVKSDGKKVSHPIDSETVLLLNEENDLKRGSLYLPTLYLPPQFLTGLGGYTASTSRNLLITYEAGYVLPRQETEDEPSDLPPAILGILLDVLRREFEKRIDPQRSGDLIQLQEGNVNRMWGTGVMMDLAKKGYFTKGEQEILKTFGNRRTIYTV